MPLKPRKEGFQLPARSGPSLGEVLDNPGLYPEEYARLQQAVLPVIEAAKRTVESPEFQAMIRQIIENTQRIVQEFGKMIVEWANSTRFDGATWAALAESNANSPQPLQLPSPRPVRQRPRQSDIDALQTRVERLERQNRELQTMLAFESVEYPQIPPEFFGKN